MRQLRQTVMRRLRGLPADEGGQSAMFAVITLMLLVIVVAYTYNVGMTASQRLRVQNAADAAAYSGAVAQANGLASIAWLNNCETYLHSKLQQHMLDVVMYSTAGSIAEWGRYTKATYDNADHNDRDTYEPYPFLTPVWFIPIPFVVDNTGPLETRVLGRMTDLDGASGGYPPDDEFKTVLDSRTFRRLLPATTLQDILDQLMDNFGDLDFGEDNPLSGMMDTVGDLLQDGLDQLADAVFEAVVGAVREAMADLFKNFMKYLISGGSPNISIGKIMKKIMSSIADSLKEAIQEIVEDFLSSIVDEIGGRFSDFIDDIMDQILDFQKDEYASFEEVFDDDLYRRLEKKYGETVAGPEDLVRVTRENVLADARQWIADPGARRRPGELWIRQLSLTAAALARALPGMVRNEVVHSVAINAPRGAMIAIHPAPQPQAADASGRAYAGGAGGAVVWDGTPALAGDDGAAGDAFFRYDAWTEGYETNRFLAESRRQAQEQGYRYVRRKNDEDADVDDKYEIKGEVDSIITKPEILYWWDEIEGRVRDDGAPFAGMLRCWNKRDRIIEDELPADDEEWENCPIGYAPGRTPGSPMAHPLDAENAADGHWHVRHGHSHGEDCTRTWGGFEIGIFGPMSLRCFWKCLGLAIGGVNHHMQYLNHQPTYHWDGLVEGEDNKHVYCEVAVSNTRTTKVTDSSGAAQAEFKSQYPDLVPGLRFTKICWMCRFYWFSYVFFVLPDCACTRCPPPNRLLLDPEPSATPRPRSHNTAGDPWGFFFEYMPFPPAAWPLDNWPEEDGSVHSIFSTGPFAQYFPGHFWTRADWEAFFSGDKFYYDADHYLSMPTDTREGVTGIGIPDALFDMMPEGLRRVFYIGAEMAGRVENWKSRKGHHGFMTCPLCVGECPICERDHFGCDQDGDEQSDVGMTYADVLGGAGDSSNGHDYASGDDYNGFDLGVDINAPDHMECDRFHRPAFAPRTETGQARPELAPAVMLTENAFKYGLSVAVWAPHRTYFFRRFFGERTGYVAVATARTGFVEPEGDPVYTPTSPRQIVTGVGEPRADGGVWDLPRIRSEFLAFRSNRYVRSNLYYPEWGAKLVPTRTAILPVSAANRKRFWREIGAVNCYTADGRLTATPLRDLVTHGGDADRWSDFVEDYVDWMD